MKNLLIIGTGGFSREVYYHAQNSIGYRELFCIKGFLEGNVPLAPERYVNLPLPVYGSVLDYRLEQDDAFVIAIADVNAKQAIADIIDKQHGEYLNLIHKMAVVFGNPELGTDVILCPFTSVSCHVKIGNHIMLNSHTSVGHDAVLGDYSSIMAHVDITGGVTVGKATYWGSGSRALPHSKIGDYAWIGAGSVVLKNVKEGQKVFGNPALAI